MVGEKNSQHFFVATQDAALRTQMSSVSGVPLLRVVRGQLVLDPPSEASRTAYRKHEKDKTGPTPQQQEALERKRKELDGEDSGKPPQEPEQKKKRRVGPKGVNPLAMKKPKRAVGVLGAPKKKRQHRKRGKGAETGVLG
eukprot:CAMPEP_0202819020 /NCGR_PEP_ID=MMETSP1389-20130828/8787_1 /ASSEMBLY_ACC=CAM_ASM_000865 /TAXON_ID=302021 /ORGANISM="Rhodomonas sp., Strain CCMP768" /LENGTH=139 /DNA_ID=CAMNT_0049491499 /DNA_START=165 /DNA_END=584 /DNA_ORIENTATION=-